MQEKHPRSSGPPNLQHLGTSARALTPTIDCDDVRKAVGSFNPRSGAGPSGLRPAYLQEALKTEHRDE
eukprot:12423916-Karenia_brevis.AAC.1